MQRTTHTPIRMERFSVHETCIGLTVNEIVFVVNIQQRRKNIIRYVLNLALFFFFQIKEYAYRCQFSNHNKINIDHRTFHYKHLQCYRVQSPPRSCQCFCYICFYNLYCMFCCKIFQTCRQDNLQYILPLFCNTLWDNCNSLCRTDLRRIPPGNHTYRNQCNYYTYCLHSCQRIPKNRLAHNALIHIL